MLLFIQIKHRINVYFDTLRVHANGKFVPISLLWNQAFEPGVTNCFIKYNFNSSIFMLKCNTYIKCTFVLNIVTVGLQNS